MIIMQLVGMSVRMTKFYDNFIFNIFVSFDTGNIIMNYLPIEYAQRQQALSVSRQLLIENM